MPTCKLCKLWISSLVDFKVLHLVCSNGQDLCRDDDAKQRAVPADEVMSADV